MASIESISHIQFPSYAKGGRKANKVMYTDRDGYVVGTLVTKETLIEFLIDKDDEARVQEHHWYTVTNCNYIGTGVCINGKKKTLYLHNFIMNRLDFSGKGVKESVDHINRNGLDNRKANLRIASQSLQCMNRTMKPRYLPDGTHLPRHMWYIKPNGLHGERIGIDIRTRRIKWKSTSSKKVSLQEKVQEALAKREEFYKEFPELYVE
jgi:hypothetical protein